MRTNAIVILGLLLAAAPARAQWVVIDPANLVQTIQIADRTLRHLETLRAQYETIRRMGEGLGNMQGYRIPTIPIASHDTGRWSYGGTWLTGLNSGDPRGTAYMAAARRLERPGALLQRLPPAARRAVENAYATIEITDSVAQMGGHQVSLVRGYNGLVQNAVDFLESDVLNGLLRFHEMTAILDKIAAGELLGRRQDTATNQLLSHSLEQLLARSKRLRDTETANMNMRLNGVLDGRAASTAVVDGAANDLRSWRQP